MLDAKTDEATAHKEILDSFIAALASADGRLLALPNGQSRLGEPMFISARFGPDEVTPNISYLNVDVFAKRGEAYIPVGIYDWEITGQKAVGNKQRHGHLPAANPTQAAAERYWSTGEAFHVRDDTFLKYASENGGFAKMSELRKAGVVRSEEQWRQPLYQSLGIGSLLIAAAAIALDKQGITEMSLGTLSEPARRAWKGFGRGERLTLSPTEVAGHEKTKSTLAKFLL